MLTEGQMIFPDKVCVILSAAIHLLHASTANPGNKCYIMSLKIDHPNNLFRAPAGGLGHGFCPVVWLGRPPHQRQTTGGSSLKDMVGWPQLLTA
jgi:hypothetical protein